MIDILLNNDNDLKITDNDVVIGVSDLQHQELILVCQKGEFKENPLSTVGIANYLRDDDIDGMLHEVRSCFAGDGMIVNKMAFKQDTNELDYESNYTE